MIPINIPVVAEKTEQQKTSNNQENTFDWKYITIRDIYEDLVEKILSYIPKKSININTSQMSQSLSIDVPWKCPNACKYCVSAMHEEDLWEIIKSKSDFEDYRRKYVDAMTFIKDRWTDTLILTWSLSDPIVNNWFLEFLGSVNDDLWDKKFRKMEIQTSWILIDDAKLDLLEEIWIKTISISLSSLDSKENVEISWIKQKLAFNIPELTKKIKDRWFNLRLSFNLNKSYHEEFKNGVEWFFEKCESLWADQVIFRELYSSGEWEIDDWIKENKFDDALLRKIKRYIVKNGRVLWRLPFWQLLYSVNWKISTLIDDNSMNSKWLTAVQKFSILRPDWKLYSHWDDKGSLIF